MFLDEIESYDRTHAIDRTNGGSFMKRSRGAETDDEKRSKAMKRLKRRQYTQTINERVRDQEFRRNASR